MKRTSLKLILLSSVALMMGSAYAIAEPSAEISFDSNPSTGYSWTGFVMSGDCIRLENAEGEYLAEEQEELIDGAGGQTTFRIEAENPGRSLCSFTYVRPWENDVAARWLYLVNVDENLDIEVSDVTLASPITGVAQWVDEEEGIVMLYNKEQGEIQANWSEMDAYPVEGEEICIYTDGTMTMSLPPIVSTLFWERVAPDKARTVGYSLEEQMVLETAEEMITLAAEENYVELMGAWDEVRSTIERYASVKDTELIGIEPLSSVTIKKFFDLVGAADADGFSELSETALNAIEKKIFDATIPGMMVSQNYGAVSAAALSITRNSKLYANDAENGFYLLEYENGVGIVAAIWNEGTGLTQVTTCFVPSASECRDSWIIP